MGMGAPDGKKAYSAINVSASPYRLGFCGCTKKRAIITSLLVIGIWIIIKGYRSNDPGMSFVSVNGQRFEADCRPLYLAGFNTHDLVQAALMTTYDYKMKKSGKVRIREMFRQASASGLNVIRTWAHTNHKKFPFQEKPGHYEEETFKALDYILDEARKHGIRVILSFIDNWKYYNGVDQYVDWSSTSPDRGENKRPEDKDGDPTPMAFQDPKIKEYEVGRHSLFYTDAGSKEVYKKHVKAIIERKNHLSGVVYREDPTIFAWDLLNEPRCETWIKKDCPQLVQAWIEEMAPFVKELDSNHLVTIGSEGFFADDSELKKFNPQDWGQDMGQNWTGNHEVTGIDFATIHVWPNNWESQVEQAMQDGKNVQGSLFWRWNMPLFSHMGRGDYGVRPEDSTFQYVLRHTGFVNAMTNSQPPGQSCASECWVPNDSGWTRDCKHMPEVCAAFWDNKNHKSEGLKVYPTKSACCRPGQGAFEEGCSWSIF
ncbi:hypothetical protein BSKO_12859 [Bryopsis sp. KO-2023]|nr:hypothetical protein BSKO_12859 [Bryopsis sp. KO-2023]